jgi:hypothetical protein
MICYDIHRGGFSWVSSVQNFDNSLRSDAGRETGLLRWLDMVKAAYGANSLEAGLVMLDLQDEYDATGNSEQADEMQRQANAILVRHVKHARFRNTGLLPPTARKLNKRVCEQIRTKIQLRRYASGL